MSIFPKTRALFLLWTSIKLFNVPCSILFLLSVLILPTSEKILSTSAVEWGKIKHASASLVSRSNFSFYPVEMNSLIPNQNSESDMLPSSGISNTSNSSISAWSSPSCWTGMILGNISAIFLNFSKALENFADPNISKAWKSLYSMVIIFLFASKHFWEIL